MFENSLVIIKPDYMNKRKILLLTLLKKGFQIQANRKILFTPEMAAEFYQEMAQEKGFMLQVILLSKGTAEAFIVTKENAVEDLLTAMICFFCTTNEMERNVHVTKSPEDVQREISFIFPNYIHEPVAVPRGHDVCSKEEIFTMLEEIYNMISTDSNFEQNWRPKFIEWLSLNNKLLPRVSNQCSRTPPIGYDEKGLQVNLPVHKKVPCHLLAGTSSVTSSAISMSSAGSSKIMSSSSCISCTCFDSDEICRHGVKTKESCEALIKAKSPKVQDVNQLTLLQRMCGDVVLWERHCEQKRRAQAVGRYKSTESAAPPPYSFVYTTPPSELSIKDDEVGEFEKETKYVYETIEEVEEKLTVYDDEEGIEAGEAIAAEETAAPEPEQIVAADKGESSAALTAPVEAEPSIAPAATVVEEPTEPAAEEPAAEEPAAEEPAAAEPAAEEPAAEEPAAEEPAAEAAPTENAAADEQPAEEANPPEN